MPNRPCLLRRCHCPKQCWTTYIHFVTISISLIYSIFFQSAVPQLAPSYSIVVASSLTTLSQNTLQFWCDSLLVLLFFISGFQYLVILVLNKHCLVPNVRNMCINTILNLNIYHELTFQRKRQACTYLKTCAENLFAAAVSTRLGDSTAQTVRRANSHAVSLVVWITSSTNQSWWIVTTGSTGRK